MAIFCYRCKECGTSQESTAPAYAVLLQCCGSPRVIRDYRAEGVGTNLGELRKSLHPDFHESLFLPEAKDYISKDDPDGSKGIRNWNENHEPRSQNKNPKRPKTHKTLWAAPKRKND